MGEPIAETHTARRRDAGSAGGPIPGKIGAARRPAPRRRATKDRLSPQRCRSCIDLSTAARSRPLLAVREQVHHLPRESDAGAHELGKTLCPCGRSRRFADCSPGRHSDQVDRRSTGETSSPTKPRACVLVDRVLHPPVLEWICCGGAEVQARATGTEPDQCESTPGAARLDPRLSVAGLSRSLRSMYWVDEVGPPETAGAQRPRRPPCGGTRSPAGIPAHPGEGDVHPVPRHVLAAMASDPGAPPGAAIRRHPRRHARAGADGRVPLLDLRQIRAADQAPRQVGELRLIPLRTVIGIVIPGRNPMGRTPMRSSPRWRCVQHRTEGVLGERACPRPVLPRRDNESQERVWAGSRLSWTSLGPVSRGPSRGQTDARWPMVNSALIRSQH